MNTITIPIDARGLAAFCADLHDALPATARWEMFDEARRIARDARHQASVIEATRRPVPYGGFDSLAKADMAFLRAKDNLRQLAVAGALLLQEEA